MLARENSGFSVDASVRITLIDRDVPSYFQSLEHLLRYCARPPFALERLSVMRGEDGRIACVRYVLPRHKAANWVGPGRGRKSTRPLRLIRQTVSPFEFLDRLADLVPPPRKHRHRYHGVFAPNHKLRSAVTAHDKRECRQAARCRDRSACGQRACGARRCHRRLLRLMRQTALPRHLADCLGETHGPRGGGVSARVPGVWWRHPAHRVQTVLPVRNHPWPSHCWQPPVASDILSASRGRSGRSWHISANRSNHRPSLPPVAHRPTGESSCRSTRNAT